MLKDTLKNYMDSYIKVYLKERGKYPQADAEMDWWLLYLEINTGLDNLSQLKAENALEWTRRMNNVRACVREIVSEEIIYG